MMGSAGDTRLFIYEPLEMNRQSFYVKTVVALQARAILGVC